MSRRAVTAGVAGLVAAAAGCGGGGTSAAEARALALEALRSTDAGGVQVVEAARGGDATWDVEALVDERRLLLTVTSDRVVAVVEPTPPILTDAQATRLARFRDDDGAHERRVALLGGVAVALAWGYAALRIAAHRSRRRSPGRSSTPSNQVINDKGTGTHLT